MRTFVGIVLLILGVPVLLIGAAVAVLAGPDDTVDVVTETVDAQTAALVVPSTLVGVSGPTLVVTAEADGSETFVGAAHPVHVASFLEGVPHTRVTAIDRSRDLTLSDTAAEGDEVTLPPPADLDWWQERSVGAGSQTVEVELTDEPLSVVVSAAQPAAPLDVTVTGAVRLDYVFVTAVVVGVVGLALVVLGILALRAGRRRRRARSAPIDDPIGDDPDTSVPGADTGRDDNVRPLHPEPTQPPNQPPGPATRPPAPGAGGRTFRVLGIVAPTTALLAGGCMAIPQPVEDTSNAVVATTRAQNEAFFATYTETNNEANAAQDPALLAGIETGPLLAASEFGFAVEKAQEVEPVEPFTIRPNAVAAPTFESYPMFAFASATKGDGAGSVYALVRPGATEPWRAAGVVDLAEEQPLDLTAAVGGSPTVADPAAAAAGLAALDTVRAYAETGTAPEGLDAEAGRALADLHGLGYSADPNADGIESLARTCEIAEAVEGGAWLETDAGVLTVAVARCTQELRTTAGFWFTPDAPYGTIAGGTDLTSTTVSGIVPFVAEVSDDGTVTVHGGRLSLTRTEGAGR